LVFQNSEYSRYINENYIALKIYTRNEEGKKFKEQFAVRAHPTVIFLNARGQEVDRILGWNGDAATFYQYIIDFRNGHNTLAEMQTKLEQDPQNVEMIYQLVQKYQLRGEDEKTKPYYTAILELDPQDTFGHREEARGYLADIQLWETGDDQPLVEFLSKAKNNDLIMRGYEVLIRHYQRNNQPEKLQAAYESALEKLPEDYNLMNGYAWYIYQNKLGEKYTRGIEVAQRAVGLKPNAAYIWDTLAWLEFENGQAEQALADMKKAVELSGNADDYRENLKTMQSGIK
jgi:Tfp pilus assembly protein PilF